MALIDLFVLDLTQTFLNEPIHNIFTYERQEEDGAPINLINAFIEDVMPALNILQSNKILNRSLKAYSLGSLDLIDERVVAAGGAISGDMLPVFNAINYTLKPTSRAVRPGSKRFAGVPEAVQVDGTITDAAYITAMEGLRVAIDASISDEVGGFWAPVVVKRVKYVPDPERPDHFAYRFPEIGETPVYAALRAVLLNTKISHQTSRGN